MTYASTTTLSDEVVEFTDAEDPTAQFTVTLNAELFGLPESEAEEEEGGISTAASLLTIGASLMVYFQ